MPHRIPTLLCVAAYALLGSGFLLWFGGLVAGFGGSGTGTVSLLIYGGVALAGLSIPACLASLILAAIGRIRTPDAGPWTRLLLCDLGFVAAAILLYALYAPRG